MIFIIPGTKRQLMGAVILYSLIGGIVVLSAEYSNYLEYTKYGALKDFSSVEELIVFLRNDDTSDMVWTEEFTCDGFSRTLIQRAKEKGYFMDYHALYSDELSKFTTCMELIRYVEETETEIITQRYQYGLGIGHAVCVTYINGDRVVIEPQNDAILGEVDGKYSVLYEGEIREN